MTLKSNLGLATLLLSIGTLSFYTTSALLSNNPREKWTSNDKKSNDTYFDVDKEMFEFMKRTQDELYINPLWYFHYARRQTDIIKS